MPAQIEELLYNGTRRLDLYCTEEPGRPLVICVHGGGFVTGDKRDERCRQAAELLGRAGFNCASISYSLSDPGNRFGMWPRNLLDLVEAVTFLHGRTDDYGYDMSRFAFLGFSAGCCLSNLYLQGGRALFREFGFEPEFHQPSALVGFYGPYDFSIRQSERRSTDQDINRLHSPRYWLQRRTELPPAPILHIHGDADDVVYFDQHEALRHDCLDRGYPFEEIVAGGFGHSFAPRDSNKEGESLDLEADIVEFLGRQLLP